MISPLKTCFTGLVAAALLSSAGAQTSSSTPVIGYYKFQAPAGKSLWSCAFISKTDFQGLATTVAGGASTVITQTGATWTANQFQTSAVPATQSSHYVEILSGPNAGVIADITSNTATTITVAGNYGSTPFTYAVRVHATLGSIFKSAGLSEFEDEVIVYDHSGVGHSYQYDGTPGLEHMVDTPTQSVISDDVVVYPAQGVLFSLVTAKTLTFGGGSISYVKTTPTKIPVYRGIVNIVGLMNPIVASSPLAGGLGSTEQAAIGTIGLTTSGLSEYEDEISVYGLVGGIFQKQGPTYYTDDSTHDVVQDDGTVVSNSVIIPNGTAILVKPSTTDKVFTQPVLHPTN